MNKRSIDFTDSYQKNQREKNNSNNRQVDADEQKESYIIQSAENQTPNA